MYAPPGVKTSPDMPVPDTMQAWVLGDPGELKLTEKPVPVPKRAEVLVRIDAVAICATDLEIIWHGPPASIQGGMPFNKNFTPGPRIHGHGRGARTRRRRIQDRPARHGRNSCGLRPVQALPRRHVHRRATTTASTTATSTRATAPTASPPTAASASTRSTTSTRWSRSPTRCRTRRRRWSSPPAPRCTA